MIAAVGNSYQNILHTLSHTLTHSGVNSYVWAWITSEPQVSHCYDRRIRLAALTTCRKQCFWYHVSCCVFVFPMLFVTKYFNTAKTKPSFIIQVGVIKCPLGLMLITKWIMAVGLMCILTYVPMFACVKISVWFLEILDFPWYWKMISEVLRKSKGMR